MGPADSRVRLKVSIAYGFDQLLCHFYNFLLPHCKAGTKKNSGDSEEVAAWSQVLAKSRALAAPLSTTRSLCTHTSILAGMCHFPHVMEGKMEAQNLVNSHNHGGRWAQHIGQPFVFSEVP